MFKNLTSKTFSSLLQKLKNKNFILGCCFLIVAVCLLFTGKLAEKGDFAITFLDVGQGDSIYISYGEYDILIDGGGSPHSITKAGETIVVPYLKNQGVTDLDLVINTHPDADHIGGLFPVLDQFNVGKLLLFENYEEVPLRKKLLTLAKNKKVPVVYTAGGKEYEFGEQLKILVVAPNPKEAFSEDNLNEGSLVLKISYEDFDVLTTGDLQGAPQSQLQPKIQSLAKNPELAEAFADLEVLQIPHHGSKYSYKPEWYDFLDPEYVVISVGLNNSYGHPYPEIISYWQKQQVPVFRTDLDGGVCFKFIDGRLFIEAAK